MIVDTFYKISLDESSYIYMAKKYGWEDTSSTSAVDYVRYFFQKNVIEEHIIGEIVSSKSQSINELQEHILSDAKSVAKKAVTQINVE